MRPKKLTSFQSKTINCLLSLLWAWIRFKFLWAVALSKTPQCCSPNKQTKASYLHFFLHFHFLSLLRLIVSPLIFRKLDLTLIMRRRLGFDDERGMWDRKGEENTEHIQSKKLYRSSVCAWMVWITG